MSLLRLENLSVTYRSADGPVPAVRGVTLDDAFGAGAISSGAWWYLLPPGLCVVTVVLAFTLVGRALENVLDPRAGGAE